MIEGFKTFLCEYGHDGARWSLTVQAQSWEDARARLKAIGMGQVIGTDVVSQSLSAGCCCDFGGGFVSVPIPHAITNRHARGGVVERGQDESIPVGQLHAVIRPEVAVEDRV